ncbi:hypothetical protein KsCSTR_30910 [Candidatus Kuenenia stuttgartiensis]|uniref:Uncharacterized protein n=1 Tax=Kuenenia stuttgartiensis TaxID=174633 RepID=Q1Q536_KUEST|nr:hypothetical protein KsCSTR_30910 [Candidatus Kuenenia stuttgartiensis]CAJ75129.1 unknown protein [Candidatus Kuenenia stuttgartiensis]
MTQRKTYKKGNHRLHRLRRELSRTIAQIKKFTTNLPMTNVTNDISLACSGLQT